MKLKSYVATITFLIACTGFSGILTSSDFYKNLNIDEKYKFIGYIFTYTLLATIVVLSGIILYKLVCQNIRSMEFFRKRRHLKSYVCQRSDLDKILENSTNDSENSADDQETLRLFGLYNQAFTAVEDAQGRMRGYYCLFPLTKEGEQAIKEGVFSVRKLSSSFVRKQKDKYSPMYIAGIYGGSSAIINTFLLGELSGSLKAHRSRKVYARAQSEDGLYWLTKYDFMPVDAKKQGLGHFYQIDGQKLK